MLFAKAQVDVRKGLNPTSLVDTPRLPPSVPIMRALPYRVWQKHHGRVKEVISCFMKGGGGIACDGLKQPINGRKYYGFVLHYVEGETVHALVLFLFCHTDFESADALRGTIDSAFPT